MVEFQNVSKSFWTGEQRKVILDRASFPRGTGKFIGHSCAEWNGKVDPDQHDRWP